MGNNKYTKRTFGKSKGAVTIIIAIIILSALLLVGVFITDLVVSGHETENLSYFSYNSYYASESGVEYYLYYLMRLGASYTPSVGDVFNFTMDNGSTYRVEVVQTFPSVVFKSIGKYEGTGRAIEINY